MARLSNPWSFDGVDRPDHLREFVAVQNTVAVGVRPNIQFFSSLNDHRRVIRYWSAGSSPINAAAFPPRRPEATQQIGRDGKTAEYRRETSERRLGDEHLFWVSKR